MRFLAAVVFSGLTLAPAFAQTPDGCAQFAWPVTQERNLLMRPDIPHARSGATLKMSPALAARLDLKKADEVQWSRSPERAPKNPDSFGGLLEIDSIEPGLYQITLSDEAWIDVIQNDAFLKSAAHSGRRDCAEVHKSVRFQLGKGPVIVQLSGVAKDTIGFAILPAAQ